MKAHAEITAKIIAQMETAGSNWLNPMTGDGFGLPRNAVSGHRYQGINVLILGFTGSYWATYKQWQGKGCQVRKGEKGTSIVLFKKIEIKDKATGDKKMIPMLKTFSVFSANQVDGEFADKISKKGLKKDETEIVEAADAWVAATGAIVRTDHSARAFYSPAADYIQIPVREVFTATPTSTSTEAYYSTLLHELAHWTGNKSRLDRLSMKNGFGSEGYAMEELVAELASAFQCALLDISPSPREDHAKYLNNWLKVLKDDPKAIFKAAAAAEKAVRFIEDLQPQSQSQEEAA